MKQILFQFIFLSFSICSFAQNLVVNPSFELYGSCPGQGNPFPCTNWTQPYPIAGGCSTSDYYNACHTGPFLGVPVNFLGTQNALTGVAYTGIMLYETMTPNPCGPPKGSDYREYIEGTLSSPLVAGQTYTVSFNMSLPEDVMFASNDFGVYFSNTVIALACPPPFASTVLPNTPQLSYAGPLISNTNGWTLVQWTYTAAGGEQYLTIGNFKNDANTSGTCVNSTAPDLFSYYYIDDVSVISSTPSTVLSASAVASNLLCNSQCIGTASVTPINGTSPFTYSWNNSQTNAVATGLCAGNYSVVVTDALGATATATTLVSQPSAITASVTVTASACGQSSGTAAVSAGGGISPFTYSWSNSQTASTATGLAAGNYTCTITDANGCSQSTTATVTNSNGPAAIASSTNTSCNGVNNGTASANATGGTSPYTYLWSNGVSASSATGLAAGNYTVVVADAGGCTSSAVVSVVNGTGPTISVSANTSITIGSSTNLSASGGTTYVWSPSTDLSCSNCANPIASPSATTQYCVLVSDANGCSDSACVTVLVIPEPVPCGEFYIPNAFSPNDDGENDGFKAYIDPACVKEFKLSIYSRWGEKVFETDDVTQGWDGTWPDGSYNAAVYTFHCTALLVNGKEIDVKGNVTLVQ